MTQTAQAPHYQSMSTRDLLKTIEVQQQVIADLQEAVAWRDELLSNAQLPIAARLAGYATRRFLQGRTPDKDGRHKAYLPAMGEMVGVSGATISRGLKIFSEATDALKKETCHEYDEIGNKKSTVHLVLHDSFKTPASIVLTKDIKKHGGDHRIARCNGCGSEQIIEKKVQICADCGTVYREFEPRMVNDPDPESPADDPDPESPADDPPLQDATDDPDETPNDQEPLQDAIGPVLPAEPLQVAIPYSVKSTVASCNDEQNPITTPRFVRALSPWLEKRIGDGRIIKATGKLETAQKYFYEEPGYLPDLAAYLAGDRDHVYGSRPLREDGTTYVLGFDNDDEAGALLSRGYMTALAKAGASSLCWMRRPGRWHLEIYFDTPVDARAAYAWCIAVCPELAEIRECYPVKTPYEDKRHNALSWPFYYRVGRQVIACAVEGMLPELPGELITHAGIRDTNDLRRLVDLIALAVTPAALIPPYTPPADPEPAAPEASTQGGVLLEEPSAVRFTGDDVRDRVLAESNAALSWQDVIALCGGLENGHFKAIWRRERTASVKVDPDGRFACDYGNNGSHPKKLDRFGAWCLAKGINVKEETKRRCEEYRARQMKKPAPTGKPDNQCSEFGCTQQYRHIGRGSKRYCPTHWTGQMSASPETPGNDPVTVTIGNECFRDSPFKENTIETSQIHSLPIVTVTGSLPGKSVPVKPAERPNTIPVDKRAERLKAVVETRHISTMTWPTFAPYTPGPIAAVAAIDRLQRLINDIDCTYLEIIPRIIDDLEGQVSKAAS